jgi:hypothetical protein
MIIRNYATTHKRFEQVEASVIFIVVLRKLTCLAGDSLQQDIFRWLSPPDPWKNHNLACKSRHRGSAAWFVQGNTLLEWKAEEAPSSLLWVHGKRPLISNSYSPAETDIIPFRSRRRKKRFLVCQTFGIPVSGTYRVGQLYNN